LQEHEVGSEKGLVKRLAQHDLLQRLGTELSSASGSRLDQAQVRVLPATIKPLSALCLNICWVYPPTEDLDARTQTGVDGTCLAFAGRALQEVIDYRGAHGVRWVQNGIIDQMGLWVGRVGLGDATNGAVKSAGMSFDRTKRQGKFSFKIEVDNLPPNTTDLFFAVSAPMLGDIGKHGHISVALLDDDDHGHEVVVSKLPHTVDTEAVIMCCISRGGRGSLYFGSYHSACDGNAMDYRPLIALLRRIQESCHPPDPTLHRAHLRSGKHIDKTNA